MILKYTFAILVGKLFLTLYKNIPFIFNIFQCFVAITAAEH